MAKAKNKGAKAGVHGRQHQAADGGKPHFVRFKAATGGGKKAKTKGNGNGSKHKPAGHQKDGNKRVKTVMSGGPIVSVTCSCGFCVDCLLKKSREQDTKRITESQRFSSFYSTPRYY